MKLDTNPIDKEVVLWEFSKVLHGDYDYKLINKSLLMIKLYQIGKDISQYFISIGILKENKTIRSRKGSKESEFSDSSAKMFEAKQFTLKKRFQ